MLGVYVVNEKVAIAMHKRQINISVFEAIWLNEKIKICHDKETLKNESL